MNLMPPFLYQAIDRFKQTGLASKLFFYGNKFEHFEIIARSGKITATQPQGLDGDITFDINSVEDGPWHCEVTVCQPDDLRTLAASLYTGQSVTVIGRRTLDPDHHILWWKFKGGQNEIHPVLAIFRGTI